MTNSSDPHPDSPEHDAAGTTCGLCGVEIAPHQYPNCHAVLIDESDPEEHQRTVKLLCSDCWRELDDNLSAHQE